MMRFLGAKVVLTPAELKGSGMLAKAVELAEKHGWFLCRQFENEANADAHSKTTAPEILAAFEGERLDYWVTGFGTGGTLKGVARVLRKERPDTKIIVCEPDNSQILGSGSPQERTADGTPADSHPLFRPHLMQGWSPDFIPKLTEDAVANKTIDKIVPVNGDDALRLSKALAREEGIFVGISAGATLAGALEACKGDPDGTTVLCMLPDTGERYLSTPLFEDIPVEMTDEEIEISKSTPSCRFDARQPVAVDDEEATEVAAPADAVAFLNETLGDYDHPVVMFSHEWCEFCWSVRKMFALYEIPYVSVDLDSVAYQQDNKGGKIRAALREKTGSKTIPQIFIGGQYVGGATELFDSKKEGSLAELLDQNKVIYNKEVDVDPYTFLPGWLHRR
jgi:cysteine synthase A